MNFSRKSEKGFTVVELIVAIVVLVVLTTFFIIQRNSLEASQRDQQRKTAVNAMYYDLKEVFFAKNNYYPKTISRDNLTAIDPDLFTDPTGTILSGDKYVDKDGNQLSSGNYHYSATNCNSDGQCKNFKLTADMETEAQFVKSSN
jgi:prepilin-type N-terminal cleavage/methylation domain-containing protein